MSKRKGTPEMLDARPFRSLGLHDGPIVAREDEAVIDEGGPVGSGQVRAVVSTKAFGHGETIILTVGVFQAVGESRRLVDNPNQFATTVIHVA
jgi:hypothetical protein